MYETFIPFEPEKQPPPSSSQVPGLLFVTCDQRSGRTQEHIKPRLRQHVMRTHLVHDRKSKARLKRKPKPVSTSGDLDDPSAAASGNNHLTWLPPLGPTSSSSCLHAPAPAHATEMYLGDPLAMLGDSFGTLSLPFETGYDAKMVLKWMVAGHDSMQAERFKTACTFYLHGLWQWAATQKLAFDGLAVYTYRKRLELAGDSVSSRREYLQQKGNLIEAIQQEIIKNKSSTDGAMLFAIVALASCSVREMELRASTEQLITFRSICRRNTGSLVCWVYLWLVDLRHALFTDSRPVLDYNIPSEFEKPHSQYKPAMSVRSDAKRLALLSPKAKNAFCPPRTEELFSKLLRLCSISENLATTATLPLYELYEIEYELRMVHACVLDDPPSPTRMCVELTVLAVQLSVWIAARLFAPLTQQAKHKVLRRANHLLASVSPLELLDAWIKSAQADAVSLFWVLTLFASCYAADELVSFPGLAYVTKHLSIKTEREFLNELQRWPPQKAWNGSQYSSVWAKLTKFRGESPNIKMSQKRSKGSIASGGQHVSRPKRAFFGAFEFWDT